MKRKQYMISPIHYICRPETQTKPITLEIYSEPGFGTKKFNAGDILYASYTFAADVEMIEEIEEEEFYRMCKQIEREILYKGSKVCDESYVINLIKKELGYDIKNFEFVYFLKRLHILVNGTEYSTDEVDLSKSLNTEQESGV